jgi:hypothetical protein
MFPASPLQINPIVFAGENGKTPFSPEPRDYLVARLIERFGSFEPQLLTP